jgi:GTP-sensing pleiotropic transcriptional regulator CodY
MSLSVKIDEHKYFSKKRQKLRCQNYCKVCEKPEKAKRSAKYFIENKADRLEYAKEYRANEDNKEKIKILKRKFKAKYREELKECYVRELLVQKHGFDISDLINLPEIVETKKIQLQIKRKIKNHGKK